MKNKPLKASSTRRRTGRSSWLIGFFFATAMALSCSKEEVQPDLADGKSTVVEDLAGDTGASVGDGVDGKEKRDFRTFLYSFTTKKQIWLNNAADSAPLTDEQEEQARLAQALIALRLVALVLAVVALVLLPVIVLAAGKLLRRRGRRSAASPEVAIVGAWEELVDTYTDARIAVPRDGTRLQIARELGRPRAVQLAQAVDVAVFGEHPPEPEQAHAVWALVDAERAEVLGRGGARAVLRHALSPASFLRRLDTGTGSTAGWPTARRKEAVS